VRGNDCHETPAEAVHPLLKVETISDPVWEFACGPGAIVLELRASGRTVIATDLVDYGCPDSESGIDFLMQWRAPPGVELALTNPPNKLATEFVAHALKLVPKVITLHPVQFLAAEKRDSIIGALARVHVFRRRLPMMHRLGWDGPKSTSQVPYAWFCWERDHVGPALLDRIDWSAL
jgi:hypothetical protein